MCFQKGLEKEYCICKGECAKLGLFVPVPRWHDHAAPCIAFHLQQSGQKGPCSDLVRKVSGKTGQRASEHNFSASKHHFVGITRAPWLVREHSQRRFALAKDNGGFEAP